MNKQEQIPSVEIWRGNDLWSQSRNTRHKCSQSDHTEVSESGSLRRGQRVHGKKKIGDSLFFFIQGPPMRYRMRELMTILADGDTKILQDEGRGQFRDHLGSLL